MRLGNRSMEKNESPDKYTATACVSTTEHALPSCALPSRDNLAGEPDWIHESTGQGPSYLPSCSHRRHDPSSARHSASFPAYHSARSPGHGPEWHSYLGPSVGWCARATDRSHRSASADAALVDW